jgi:hypothetical protein
MKTYYTGTTGSILLNGNTLTDVAEWSIEADQTVVETTTLGDPATTFRYSRPSYSGNLTVLATEGADADIALITEGLMRTPFSPQPTVYDLFLITKGNKLFTTIRCQALFESVGYQSRPGEIIAATLSFRANGLFTEYGWNGTRTLELQTGQFATTFNPIVLRYDVLVINTLAIAVTGNEITFRRQRLELDTGVFDIAFADVPMTPSFALLNTLEIDINYADQELIKDSIIEPAVLDIEIDGEDQSFDRIYIMALDAGVFTTGFNAIDLNQSVFETVTYTGNGSTLTVTGVGFQPSIVWTKRRSGATGDHVIYDQMRGATIYWRPSNTGTEITSATTLTSFDSDGFTLGNSTVSNVNNAAYVSWCWPPLGANVSDTNGTITTTVSKYDAYGISVFTYTGNGSSGATIGHGLSSTPDFVLIKNRGASGTAGSVGSPLLTSNHFLNISANSASASNSTLFQGYGSTNVTLGNSANVNANANTYIGYAFASKIGKSKIATYSGTGATDNSITTGFTPSFILIKSLSSGNWMYFDDVRGVTEQLIHTTAVATTVDKITFDANGFTVKANADTNTNAVTFIYMAFR